MAKTYHLFISHSWTYRRYYDRIVEFLEEQDLSFHNYFVPINDPIHTNGTDKELEIAIEAKIKRVSCVIILAGVYSSYSKWIQKEIKIALHYRKTIIAVEPWGVEKISKIVRDNADEVVGWNSKSIVRAIVKYG